MPSNLILRTPPNLPNFTSINIGNNQNLGIANNIVGSGNIISSNNSILLGNNNTIEGNTSSSSIIGSNNIVLSDSSGTSINGNYNNINKNSINNIIFGNNNTFSGATTRAFIVGSGNIISGTSLSNSGATVTTTATTIDSIIFGSNNIISSTVDKGYIFGSNNLILSGVSNSFIIGNNITGDTSNTTYVTNIVVFSGVTLPGGIVMSGGAANFCSTGLKTRSITSCAGGGFFDYANTPNYITISTDDNTLASEYLYMETGGGTILSSSASTTIQGGAGVTVKTIFNGTYDNELAISNSNDSIRILRKSGVSNSNYLYGINNAAGNKTSDNNTIPALFLASQNSTFLSSVVNSVCIGGSGLTATSINTVYTPDINIKTNKGISFGTGTTRTLKEINIGNWNMTATSFVNIAHGLSSNEWKTVRQLDVVIRDDSDSTYYQLTPNGGNAAPISGEISYIDSTNIALNRTSGGPFDAATFTSTGYNRGYITFWYHPD